MQAMETRAMRANPRPARVLRPGRILRRELEARGWTQKDLAEIMGRPAQAISQIVRGQKQITPETALELAAAFGTSPALWLSLESNYRLFLARRESDGDQNEIARKSRLYALTPVAELTRRGWIQDRPSLPELEREICAFLGIDSPDQQPALVAGFRQTVTRDAEVAAQVAWVRRVELLVREQSVEPYNPGGAKAMVNELLSHAESVEQISRVPHVLHRYGIHFAAVPHLSHTYLDGAALLVEERPVVALTLRYDRIDSFWFTLLHELAHIVAGHPGIYLDNLDKTDGDEVEEEANAIARDWLLDPGELRAFVSETRPYFSRERITSFAQSQGRHPGIVLGRLQHEQLVPYANLRNLLVKVKSSLTDWIDSSGPV